MKRKIYNKIKRINKSIKIDIKKNINKIKNKLIKKEKNILDKNKNKQYK